MTRAILGGAAATLLRNEPTRTALRSIWVQTSVGTLPWDPVLGQLANIFSGPVAHAFMAFAFAAGVIVYGVAGKSEAAGRLLKAGFVMTLAIEAVKLLNYFLPN